MTAAIRQAVLLFLIAMVLAGITAWLHPRAPQWNPAIRTEGGVLLSQVMMWEHPPLWVDARPDLEFDHGHVPGAILLNEDDWEGGLMRFFEVWDPDVTVVVYCGYEACQSSRVVARRLREELDQESVYFLLGGWEAWKTAQ